MFVPLAIVITTVLAFPLNDASLFFFLVLIFSPHIVVQREGHLVRPAASGGI